VGCTVGDMCSRLPSINTGGAYAATLCCNIEVWNRSLDVEFGTEAYAAQGVLFPFCMNIFSLIGPGVA